MQRLNGKSTRIFCDLKDALTNDYLKILNGAYLPLTMEHIGSAVLKPFGTAELYSLCHYYKQNGDLMQNPEMCFAVVDGREKQDQYNEVVIVPYMYQQANIGLYEESMEIGFGGFVSFDTTLNKKHTDFANRWLDDIREHGYLQQLAKGNTEVPFGSEDE